MVCGGIYCCSLSFGTRQCHKHFRDRFEIRIKEGGHHVCDSDISV
jgi:hypothetical protein